MSFKVITPESIPPTSFRNPRIRLTKTGSIVINRSAAWLMGLKSGDKVIFAHSDENPDDWYIAKHQQGFKLAEQQSGELAIYNKRLKGLFDDQFGTGTYGFKVSKNPTKHDGNPMWLLITAERRQHLKDKQHQLLRKEARLHIANDCKI